MNKNYSCVYSAQADVTDTKIISIETDISNGLHSFNVIGLPDKAVDEARDRVGAAIKNSGFTSPKTQNQKVTISLAPADVKKEGPSFDLGIAMSYLLASKQIDFDPAGIMFLGELSLSGEVQKVRGVLPIALAAKALGIHTLFVPCENASEAALAKGLAVFGVSTLLQLIEHINTLQEESKRVCIAREDKGVIKQADLQKVIDLSEIKGQETAKRALLIAASGGHNIALYGPPGTGKTMLARALQGILPELSDSQAFEVASIHSVAGLLGKDVTSTPPFRSPHHTSSHVAVVGGGSSPRPGEITLAHRGVLFLDEFPEFDKRVLESLREPLEEGYISISRAKGRATFPAEFILVAALNPCPCGNSGNKQKRCVCSASDLERYKRKLSGPIMDRIDMWVEVVHVPYEDLQTKNSTEKLTPSTKVKVNSARGIQSNRLSKYAGSKSLNSRLSSKDIGDYITLSKETTDILTSASTKLGLSPRSYFKVIKLARTIADLEGSESVETSHILEALQYRPRI
jgi:magnesium chelatase family protein